MKVDIVFQGYRCERCKHEWIPRKKKIRVCPKCKSPYWDVKRKKEMENAY